jgi:radical S-adenosyl methionine domain-containing protein 2
MQQPFFETASFHIVRPCNMKCKFCYATFEDMHVPGQLSKDQVFVILDKLKAAGLQKITFAGGEPLLYRWIYEVIDYSKQIGLVTSIITNGSLLTDSLLIELRDSLDWIGISVDSLNPATNEAIGRTSRINPNYRSLVTSVKLAGFKLKINTVVNRFNEHEDMNEFIKWADPARWKVFDTLRVEGQNDEQFAEVKSGEGAFDQFVQRHSGCPSLVPENNAAMTGSYLLIDPLGRLFENSKGKHTYSSTLADHEMNHCLAEIDLNRDMFIKRGGLYAW